MKSYLEQSKKLCGNRKCLDLISPFTTLQYYLFPVHAGIQSNASFEKFKNAINPFPHTTILQQTTEHFLSQK